MSTSMTLEKWPIERLQAYPHNSKIHGEEDVGLIAASISRFGFNDPIGVDENGVIIEGHGRFAAARRLGLTEVPVIILSGLTERQITLYRIAHNKIALQSSFDLSALVSTMEELSAGDISLDNMGFGDGALSALSWHHGETMERIQKNEEQRSEGEGGTGSEMDQTPTETRRVMPDYDLIFDTAEQRKRWSKFGAFLKKQYGDERYGLTAFIKDSGVMGSEEEESHEHASN